ncbi:MAG: NAD(P)-binding protein, partial [Chloroflexota bacterium]|nr:NAD(P)-binding protein [Chloroflexota bacterium]
MKNRKKVIIIGGGLGGLATAINLSKSDFEINIIEKNSNLGGKMNMFKKDGFVFDTGPSLITLPNVFEELFKEAGEDIYEHLDFIKINPLFLYMFEKEKIKYSSDLSELEKLFNSNTNEINMFYELISKGSKLFNLSQKTFFQQGLFSKPKFSNLLLLLNSPFQLFFKKYNSFIEKTFSDEKIRKIFNRYPTYVGASPYKSSSILSIIPFMELSYGAWYISGGLYKLIEKIEEIIISKNINVIKNLKV